MNHHALSFLAFSLFDGLAIAFGVYELWSMRRRRAKDAVKEKGAISPEDPGHPKG